MKIKDTELWQKSESGDTNAISILENFYDEVEKTDKYLWGVFSNINYSDVQQVESKLNNEFNSYSIERENNEYIIFSVIYENDYFIDNGNITFYINEDNSYTFFELGLDGITKFDNLEIKMSEEQLEKNFK